jgi:molybdopterin-guanine dinucleotide biosynthesis protein A
MGSPKHLLRHIDGRPLYEHTLEHLNHALPEAKTFYISLCEESQFEDIRSPHLASMNVKPLYDATSISIGPAAGLLAAHAYSPTTTWLTVGCDYPLLTNEALEQLRDEYVPPVTCFGNAQGFAEPLLGVWAPEALSQLARNVARGFLSPNKVVREMNGKIVLPMDGRWITGANTPEDWEAAMGVARSQGIL